MANLGWLLREREEASPGQDSEDRVGGLLQRRGSMVLEGGDDGIGHHWFQHTPHLHGKEVFLPSQQWTRFWWAWLK